MKNDPFIGTQTLILASKPSRRFSGLRSDATRRSRALTHWRYGIVTTFANWTIADISSTLPIKKAGLRTPPFCLRHQDFYWILSLTLTQPFSTLLRCTTLLRRTTRLRLWRRRRSSTRRRSNPITVHKDFDSPVLGPTLSRAVVL